MIISNTTLTSDLKTFLYFFNRKYSLLNTPKCIQEEHFIESALNGNSTFESAFPRFLVEAARWRISLENPLNQDKLQALNTFKRRHSENAPVCAFELERFFIEDIKSIVRYYNFKKAKEGQIKISPDEFTDWFINEWLANVRDFNQPSKGIYPDELVEIAVFRAKIQSEPKTLEKLNAIRDTFGYKTNYIVYENYNKQLLKSSAETLEGSVRALRKIHGKKIAFELIKRNKLLQTARPDTITSAHDELVKIYGLEKAKEIGFQNPVVYRSTNVKSAHDELVKIHELENAKKIGFKDPQVYTSTNVKSAHDELVKIHGLENAKKIGLRNPQVYTSTNVKSAYDKLVEIHGLENAKKIGFKDPQVYTSTTIKSAHDELVKIHGLENAIKIGFKDPQVYKSASIKSAHDELVKIHGLENAKKIVFKDPQVYKSATIKSAYDKLVEIHKLEDAIKIGLRNPQVYKSATVKPVHDELVKIHELENAKKIGLRNPQVYTSTNVKSAHDELVKIHGLENAKKIGLRNPQVYTSTNVKSAHN
ncbi:MAG: hypothetical protein HY094_01825 [Candidatus Melainabacteria bacterium]|nr:hypothetical protein [Candidatus Melainabacteria bacterium]